MDVYPNSGFSQREITCDIKLNFKYEGMARETCRVHEGIATTEHEEEGPVYRSESLLQ